MTIALVLFALAAVGGLTMAVMRFKGRPQPPLPLALIHGGAAAAGLIALIVAVSSGAASRLPLVALILFIGAALGGFLLFSYHLRKLALPMGLMVIHALVAVTAFVILLVAALSS
jgi:hypothetical protein